MRNLKLTLLVPALLLAAACGDETAPPGDAGLVADAGVDADTTDTDGDGDALDAREGADTTADAGGDSDATTEFDTTDIEGDTEDDGVDDTIDMPPPPLPDLLPPPDFCNGLPPDEACYVARHAPESDYIALARQIGDAALADIPAAERAWQWPEAVLMVGLAELGRVTGDERYTDYVRDWLDHHIVEGYSIETSDTCAPTALAVAMLRAGLAAETYQPVIDDALHYLREESLRTSEGGLNHLGTIDVFGVQLWADSLFMFGNVLTGWGEWNDDAEALDFYRDQYGIFARLMQDSEGFFHHAVYSPFAQDPDVYWARANGWILAAGFDHLRVRRNRGERLDEMERSARALADAVVQAQDAESGLWYTVVNRPGETYLETSASALFVAGLARGWRYGYLDNTVLPTIFDGIDGVMSRVVDDEETGRKVVTGTSGPTSVGTFDYYATIAQADDIPYGIGSALLALIEVSGLPAERPLDRSESVETRRAEYRAWCTANSATGGLYGQACRVADGQLVHGEAIDAAIAKVDAREDTADFAANGLVRLLYLDDETGALDASTRDAIENSLLSFRYWLTEPGDDGMAFWTENHQVLFHAAEFLTGQRFGDVSFSNDGRTGAEHAAHARPRLLRWMRLRALYGFSEWHSNVYFNEDIPALLNLYDFADDDEIRDMAAVVLEVLALDIIHSTFDGVLVTTHGRTYESKFIGGLNDSIQEFCHIVSGLCEADTADSFAGAFMATSSWAPTPHTEAIAERFELRSELRQRDSFSIEEGPSIGVGYTGVDDVVVWAGLSAIVAPLTIDGSVDVLEEYNLWDGFLFGDLPESLVEMLRSFRGTPSLRRLATSLLPLSAGMALEAVDTYVWRTPDFQLAGAQDYKPGYWSAQTAMWRAALSPEAFVLTSSPAIVGVAGDLEDVTIDEPWIGGWQPRVTLFESVGVIQYKRLDWDPAVNSVVQGDYLHAYFPRDVFDEVFEGHGWTVGRLGDAWIGLWSQMPTQWSEANRFEQLVEGLENVWVVEVGSTSEGLSFDDFVAGLDDATAQVLETGDVVFHSPTRGEVTTTWDGPLVVDGAEAELGPYARFDHAATRQRRGDARLTVVAGDSCAVIDGRRGTRRVFGAEP